KTGTGANDVNARAITAHFTPSSYTPAEVDTEGDDKISAHLNGIDTTLSTINPSAGDISEQSFSLTNDQSTPANVTGFVFSNATVRSFSALVSVYIDATTDRFEEF